MKYDISRWYFLACLFIGLMLGGCQTKTYTAYERHGQRGALRPGGMYIVQKGDTLFGIAWRYGLDIEELARWNNSDTLNHILLGQSLRTTPPIGIKRDKVVAPVVTSTGQAGWIWPVRGKVVQNFSATTPGHQGIRIQGQRGQVVHAASDGEIAYTGTGLSGFGRMIIIRHQNKILSAYGFLDDVSVREGQKVRRGQTIGKVGIGPRNIALLHFETRKQGQPVNPFSYIGTVPRY